MRTIRGGHLLTLEGVDRVQVVDVLDTAESFVEVHHRTIRKVPALTGRVVASLFFEESTRTRLSFETAAKRLSADVISLAVAASSVKKGESLRDTISTIEALGLDAVVLRHRSSGASEQVARFVPHVHVINAGDGQHQHPTQGLLDAFTVRQVLAERRGTTGRESGAELFDGLRVLIVGDVLHSRVARSDIAVYRALGANVRVVGPGTLVPRELTEWGVEVSYDLDESLEWAQVIGLLRLQSERGSGEFATHYGLTSARLTTLDPRTLVMHPGPMNRGVEIDNAVADSAHSLVTLQVANGVPVRMAVLYLTVAGGDGR